MRIVLVPLFLLSLVLYFADGVEGFDLCSIDRLKM